MKKNTKYFALFLILIVFVSIFSACIEEQNFGISTDNLIVFDLHTTISSFATNIPENPIILRTKEEVQEYLFAYVLSQPQKLSKCDWIKKFLEGFPDDFFETKAFVLLRNTWHSESYTDFFICGLNIENKTLVVNLHYLYDGSELSDKKVSDSFIISVKKKDIEGIDFTGIREINYFNSVS